MPSKMSSKSSALGSASWVWITLLSLAFMCTAVISRADLAASGLKLELSASPDWFNESDTQRGRRITISAEIGADAESDIMARLSIPGSADYTVAGKMEIKIPAGRRSGRAVLFFKSTADDAMYEGDTLIPVSIVDHPQSSTVVRLKDDADRPNAVLLNHEYTVDGLSASVLVKAVLDGNTNLGSDIRVALSSSDSAHAATGQYAIDETIVITAQEPRPTVTIAVNPLKLLAAGTRSIAAEAGAIPVVPESIDLIPIAKDGLLHWNNSQILQLSGDGLLAHENHLRSVVEYNRLIDGTRDFLVTELKGHLINEEIARIRNSEVEKTAEQQRSHTDALEDVTWKCLSTPGRTYKECNTCPEMVVVRPGKYRMGSLEFEEGRFENESPQREVLIHERNDRSDSEQAFAVGKYEITHGEYKKSRENKQSARGCWTFEQDGNAESSWENRMERSWKQPGYDAKDDHPVVCVSWNDAVRYVEWIKGLTGGSYRLLTEAEWEYVARAGEQEAFFIRCANNSGACSLQFRR